METSSQSTQQGAVILSQLTEPVWTDSGLKSGIVHELVSTLKNEKYSLDDLSNLSPKSALVRKKPPTPTPFSIKSAFCCLFLDLIPPANLQLSCEELDLDSLELPAMDDVLLPHMDADGQNMSAEVTLPTLDDSIGLVPHMGSLEIMDQSLPSTSSL